MKVLATKLIAIPCIVAGLVSNAQLKFQVTNNDLRNNLSKVIADFPNQFAALKGDTIAINPQMIEFSSRLQFREASNNSFTLYKSQKPIYSWQAVLMTAENFDDASKKYHWLYNQLKGMTVKPEGGSSFTLNGEYDAPDETKKFSSSIFSLTPGASNIHRLKIEASIQFEFPEWKVMLSVYEKEREDKERGDIKSN